MLVLIALIYAMFASIAAAFLTGGQVLSLVAAALSAFLGFMAIAKIRLPADLNTLPARSVFRGAATVLVAHVLYGPTVRLISVSLGERTWSGMFDELYAWGAGSLGSLFFGFIVTVPIGIIAGFASEWAVHGLTRSRSDSLFGQ